MKKPQMRLSLAILAISSSLTGTAWADPPPWAPAHGHRAKAERAEREHRYVYYPSRQVYYAPATSTWFWLSGGNWQVGVTLPAQYRAYVTNGVPIVLSASRPYAQHVYVEEHYGRPWREKHRHRERERRDGDRDDRRHGDRHHHDRHDDHGHRH